MSNNNNKTINELLKKIHNTTKRLNKMVGLNNNNELNNELNNQPSKLNNEKTNKPNNRVNNQSSKLNNEKTNKPNNRVNKLNNKLYM